MDASPPRYRRFSRPGPAPQSAADLPAYTRRNTLAQPVVRREPVEHIFPLEDGKGRPWASLTLRSSAKSAKSVPMYNEKEHINGSFQLHAEKGDSIHSVTVNITGRIVTGASVDDTYIFLSQSLPLWSKADSRAAGAATKLIGTSIWPFSIPLQKAVSGKDGVLYRLPETFLERHTRASVSYEISVLVSRGKLRPDSHVKTRFAYVPNIRPDPPSVLRQLAYRENSLIPGPEVDPSGWKTTTTAVIRGTMFQRREASVHCTLHLANPLSYTRGTVIPCRLTLDSTDEHALDLFSAPSAPMVTLRRCVRYQNLRTSSKRAPDWVETFEDLSRAVWWPSPSGSDTYSRSLEGEIKLPKDLASTSAFGIFAVSYTVVVSPFETVGFVASSSHQSILLEPVTIATTYARDSPRPHAYAPPEYAPLPVPRTHNDYFAQANMPIFGRF